MAGLIAFGALVWVAGHYPLWSVWAHQSELLSDGKAAEAKLIEKSVTRGRFADVYNVRYSFRVGRREITMDETVSSKIYDQAIDGSYLDIIFQRDNPQSAIIVGNDRIGRLLWIYGAINALLLLAAINIRRSVKREMAQNQGSSS